MGFDVQTDLQYDEGFAQRNLSPATWKSYNRLGLTKFPYSLDTKYPSTVSRLILDAQAVMTQYPRFMACKGDTGRCIRFQFKDDGAPINLTGYTVTVDSWTLGGVAVRTAYDISAMATEIANGFLEWVLDATDTEASFKYRVNLTASGVALTFPTSDYFYCDVEDKNDISGYDIATVRPAMKIKSGAAGLVLRTLMQDAKKQGMRLNFAQAVLMPRRRYGDAIAGTEVLTNGALTSGTGWTAQWGMALGSNRANFTWGSGIGTLQQASGSFAVPLKSSTWYRLSYYFAWTGSISSNTVLQLSNIIAEDAVNLPQKSMQTNVVYFKTKVSPTAFLINVTDDPYMVASFYMDDFTLKEVAEMEALSARGEAQRTLESVDFSSAGMWFLHFIVRGRTGKQITLPTRGHFIVEVS